MIVAIPFLPTGTRRLIARLRGTGRRLATDRSGLALLEFAFTLPLVLGAGGYGVELSSVALTNMRVSQYALNLADTTSRIGLGVANGVTQLREADVNDALQGVRLEGQSINIGDNARIILSSLENTKQSYDTAYKQRIHWQRCFGKLNGGAYTSPSGSGYASSYGTTTVSAGTTNTQADAGTDMTAGMGDSGAKVSAPQDNAVMFVEINYRYKPLFGSLFIQPRIIHYTASLLVRDNRDYRQIYNPTPAVAAANVSTCDKYNA